jgi:hypothetical protein
MNRCRLENRVMSGQATWTVARKGIIQPQKELNPQPWPIKRMDLVIEGWTEPWQSLL